MNGHFQLSSHPTPTECWLAGLRGVTILVQAKPKRPAGRGAGAYRMEPEQPRHLAGDVPGGG